MGNFLNNFLTSLKKKDKICIPFCILVLGLSEWSDLSLLLEYGLL